MICKVHCILILFDIIYLFIEKWLLDRCSVVVGSTLMLVWTIQLILRFDIYDFVGIVIATGKTFIDFSNLCCSCS